MNSAKEWRAAGYFTLFRRGTVYLVRKADGETRFGEIDSGRWLTKRFEDMHLATLKILDAIYIFDADPIAGATITPMLDLTESMRHCYCDAGVDICDFCAGLRTDWGDAPGHALPWEPAPVEINERLLADLASYRVHKAASPAPDTSNMGSNLSYEKLGTVAFRSTVIRRLIRVGDDQKSIDVGEWLRFVPDAYRADARVFAEETFGALKFNQLTPEMLDGFATVVANKALLRLERRPLGRRDT